MNATQFLEKNWNQKEFTSTKWSSLAIQSFNSRGLEGLKLSDDQTEYDKVADNKSSLKVITYKCYVFWNVFESTQMWKENVSEVDIQLE